MPVSQQIAVMLSRYSSRKQSRYTDVDSIAVLGKPHPGVENQHLVAVTHSHAIHSKLADTAERDDLENTTHLLYCLYSPKDLVIYFERQPTRPNES